MIGCSHVVAITDNVPSSEVIVTLTERGMLV